MVPRVRRCLLVLLVLSACPGAGNNGSTGTSTGPTAGTTGEQPTSGTTDACLGSGDCDSEGICVANYEAVATDPPSGMREAAECVEKTACITALDLARWCFDHRSCCENLRCHPADGTCEPRGLGETTTGTTGDTTTGTGDTTTGTSASTSTGTDTGTDTGTTGTTG